LFNPAEPAYARVIKGNLVWAFAYNLRLRRFNPTG
jgi:hypothetical protein